MMLGGTRTPCVLSIDTSGILGGVAIACGGRLLAELRCDARAAASERILPQITHVLSDLGLTFGDVDRIGVAVGPGSFTGLRVGLATAKGLAQSLGCPVAPISSLTARAHWLEVSGRPILVAAAHRRGVLFSSAGIFTDAGWTELLGEASRSITEAHEWVSEAFEAAVTGGSAGAGQTGIVTGGSAGAGQTGIVTGDATELLLAALGTDSPIAYWTPVPGSPGAVPGSVARLAGALAEEACLTGTALDDLLPNYLRGSDARLPGTRSPARAAGRGTM